MRLNMADDQRTGHHQEIRQPAALQHRHEHLRHARRPRRHGEGRRGFRRLRRQDRRGHHPLGADPDHLRAGEQGRAEPAADHVPAPAHPLLRRQHADAGAALSRSRRSIADPRAGEIPRADDAGVRRRPFGPLEDQVRRNMEMFERTFAMFTPFARARPSRRRQAATPRRRAADAQGASIDELQAPDGRDAEAPRPARASKDKRRLEFKVVMRLGPAQRGASG